jgi:hypothetical protein
MQVILKWIANMLLLPLLRELIEKGTTAVIDWYARRKHQRKVEQDTQTKVDDYVKAPTRDAARDAFNKLP